MTMPTKVVLAALWAAGERQLYGLEIGEAAGLPSGTIHPILARLESVGWVSSRWEQVDPRMVGRPARRYYELTNQGRAAAKEMLMSARSKTSSIVFSLPGGAS